MSRVESGVSFSVVKNDSERVPMAGTKPAHTVTKVNPVRPARALHRSMMDRENYSVSLFQFDDFRAGLHTRPLLRQNELATREIPARNREQKGDL